MLPSGPVVRTPTLLRATLLVVHVLLADLAFAGATEWIDVDVINGQLRIKTEIAGVAGYSMIDTGAHINAINARFLKTEGINFDKGRSVQISGVFGKSQRDTYRKVPVKAFETEINFHDLVDLDFGPPDLQLILGAGFLQLFVFQFDYPNQRMRLITRDSVDLKRIKNIESQRDPRGGSPLVKVGLSEKIDAWLVMDTGSNGGLLIERDLADRLDWLDTPATEEGEVRGVISSGNMEHFTVPNIRFGPVTVENVMVAVPAASERLLLFEKRTSTGTRIPKGGKSKGLLGYDVLKHFLITVDYKSGYVHVYPGERIAEE